MGSSKTSHLGLPLMPPRSKLAAFSSIKQKVESRIFGWKLKLLSQAGRTQLIQSVAATIPSYPMASYCLPWTLCHDLYEMLKNFWWGFSSLKSHYLTLKSWNSICTPKSMGGLGLRRMENINQALLTRKGWRFLTSPSSPWVQALNAKYLHHQSFWDIAPSSQSSWLWKSILSSRPILQQGVCHLTRNGSHTRIWCDPWIPSLPSFKPIPKDASVLISHQTTVDLLFDPITRQ